MGHAGGAVALLARERWAQPGAARGLQDGVARLVAHGRLVLLETDDERLGGGGDVGGRRLRLGEHEPLDEHFVRRNADGGEARFDRVHVRTGPAEIEVGVRAVADQRRALGRVEEPAVRVEVVVDRQPSF